MELIDSHAHLDDAGFEADREEVLARARAAGVVAQVVPAVEASGWARLGELCAAQPDLFPAYGLHPMYIEAHRPEHLEQLPARLQEGGAVAVGECGLDFYVPGLDRETQIRYFTAQLGIAAELGLPVIIHARRALDEVSKYLRRQGGLRGVVHSFSGSAQQARVLIDLGFYLGLGGPITYPRAQRLRRLAASLPLESLLIETDSPDQPDSRHRGQRNEPARLPMVLTELARLRDADPAEVAAVTTANARRLFALPD